MEENEVNESAAIADLDISTSDNMPLIDNGQLKECDERGDEIVEVVLAVVRFYKVIISESRIAAFILKSAIFSVMFLIGLKFKLRIQKRSKFYL